MCYLAFKAIRKKVRENRAEKEDGTHPRPGSEDEQPRSQPQMTTASKTARVQKQMTGGGVGEVDLKGGGLEIGGKEGRGLKTVVWLA